MLAGHKYRIATTKFGGVMGNGRKLARVQLIFLLSLYIRSFTGANVARSNKAVPYFATSSFLSVPC